MLEQFLKNNAPTSNHITWSVDDPMPAKYTARQRVGKEISFKNWLNMYSVPSTDKVFNTTSFTGEPSSGKFFIPDDPSSWVHGVREAHKLGVGLYTSLTQLRGDVVPFYLDIDFKLKKEQYLHICTFTNTKLLLEAACPMAQIQRSLKQILLESDLPTHFADCVILQSCGAVSDPRTKKQFYKSSYRVFYRKLWLKKEQSIMLRDMLTVDLKKFYKQNSLLTQPLDNLLDAAVYNDKSGNRWPCCAKVLYIKCKTCVSTKSKLCFKGGCHRDYQRRYMVPYMRLFETNNGTMISNEVQTFTEFIISCSIRALTDSEKCITEPLLVLSRLQSYLQNESKLIATKKQKRKKVCKSAQRVLQMSSRTSKKQRRCVNECVSNITANNIKWGQYTHFSLRSAHTITTLEWDSKPWNEHLIYLLQPYLGHSLQLKLSSKKIKKYKSHVFLEILCVQRTAYCPTKLMTRQLHIHKTHHVKIVVAKYIWFRCMDAECKTDLRIQFRTPSSLQRKLFETKGCE